MQKGKAAALVAAALVTGLVLGTAGIASAAPSGVAAAANGFGAICRRAAGITSTASGTCPRVGTGAGRGAVACGGAGLCGAAAVR